jgi:hypothetical protein
VTRRGGLRARAVRGSYVGGSATTTGDGCAALYLGQEGRYRLALASMLMSFAFCAVMTVLTIQFWQEAWENNWR